jgi:hypothetical protein
MATQTKAELVDEVGAKLSKNDLVEVLGSKLRKDQIASILDEEGDATKDELVHKLGSRKKEELVQALGEHLTKDELQRVLERDESSSEAQPARRQERERDDADDLDWTAELEWAPPPRPTPAPVRFAGAAPFLPGQRVRVDLAGLPMLGVFAGKGASAAGTIVGVDAQAREVRVYLDAVFGGAKELALPPERITPDG